MTRYLTDRRKELGLTMKQVAEAVGVSEATVSRWESGQIANMRRDRINNYAKILRVDPNFIMTGENKIDNLVGGPSVSMKMLRELRKAKGLSMKELGAIIGVAESTVSQYENGKRQPDFETLLLISEYFDVSVDYLLRGNHVLPEGDTFNTRDQRDIAKDLAAFKDTLENGEGLMFDGDPMSEEAKASILAAIETGLRVVKVMNKEKYTPKKYKKD